MTAASQARKYLGLLTMIFVLGGGAVSVAKTEQASPWQASTHSRIRLIAAGGIPYQGRLVMANSARTKHGALLDAELLAEVYLELVGGKQAALDLSARRMRMEGGKGDGSTILSRPRPLPVNLIDAERNAHQAFIEELGEDAVWRQYQ